MRLLEIGVCKKELVMMLLVGLVSDELMLFRGMLPRSYMQLPTASKGYLLILLPGETMGHHDQSRVLRCPECCAVRCCRQRLMGLLMRLRTLLRISMHTTLSASLVHQRTTPRGQEQRPPRLPK